MPGWSSNRRTRLSLVAVLAALGLALLAPHAGARVAYVISADGDAVRRIDTATNQVIGAPIPVGDQPETLAITPDGRILYVANNASKDITAIDTATNQPVATISLGGFPTGIAISPDGATAYVAVFDSINNSFVTVIDPRTNQISAPQIPVGEFLSAIAFAPNGGTAYAVDAGQGVVHVIDTQTRQVVGAPIPVGGDASGIAFTPDGKTAYVAEEEESKIFAIDTQTRQVTTIPIPSAVNLFGVTVTPNGTKAYIIGTNAFHVVDLQTRQVGPPIPIDLTESELTITPDGRTGYVSHFLNDTVSVIDTQANRVVDTIAVADAPWEVAIVPNQSPVASFGARPSKATTRVKFNGSRSTDPDGTVSIFDWGFGDGSVAANAGATPSHTYRKGGRFPASLAVVDNEGCSGAQVFTGRTAYCSGSALSAQAKTVTVAPNRFKFGRLVRNARKDTAKLRVRVPVGGRVVLSGKQVRKVSRSTGKAGTVVLTIKPKKKLRNALELQGSAKTKVRVSFRPTGGTAFSKARSILLVLKEETPDVSR